MSIRSKGKRLLAGVCIAAVVPLLILAGCQAQQAQEQESAVTTPIGDNAATIGEYDQYDPGVEAEETAGEAIEGSEEEELQQERIAGGAVGGVVSQNLEPLTGITDPSEGEYVPNFGLDFQAPAIGHSDKGSDCLSCHQEGGQGTAQPKSHTDSQLANEDCGSCHAAQG